MITLESINIMYDNEPKILKEVVINERPPIPDKTTKKALSVISSCKSITRQKLIKISGISGRYISIITDNLIDRGTINVHQEKVGRSYNNVYSLNGVGAG